MKSITRFIEEKLKLKVNRDKSTLDRPWKLKFLGFSFYPAKGGYRIRIRMCFWKQWKKIKTKHENLIKLGIDKHKAWEYANTRKSYWRISNGPVLAKALTNQYLKKIGLISISEMYSLKH